MIDPREYVTEQLSIIVGAPVMLTDTQVNRFWTLLTRDEERGAEGDRHDNYPHTSSVLARQGLLEYPPLHDEIAALAAGSVLSTPRWPYGHRFAACLTHDVDRIVRCPWRERLRQYIALRGRATPVQILRWCAASVTFGLRALAGDNDLAPYDYWLDEESRHGFHSTFFILPEQLAQPTVHDHFYHYHDIVLCEGIRMSFASATQQVRKRGWEIGLHGSYDSAFNAQILRAERDQLECMLGQPVSAVRQHFLRFNIDITPHVQQQAGFTVDSTLGYSKTIGCRAGLAFPYFWLEGDLLEIPLIIQDVGLLRNGKQSRDLSKAIACAEALIVRIAEVGGLVTLSWHTHPDSPGALACYRALLDIISALDGWGCSAGELNDWWRERKEELYPNTMR